MPVSCNITGMALIDRPRIGIDLGGTKIEAIILDGHGRIHERQRTPSPGNDYHAIIEAVASLVVDVCDRNGLDTDLPVGIGTPGAISLKTGMMKNCNSTCLNGMPLAEDLAARLGVPVRLANDADCFALSEASDGAGAGATTVFGVILGTGVGGGICIGGQLLQGVNAICGEWGHNALPLHALENDGTGLPSPQPNVNRCYCGRFDCVETWLSGPAFEREYQRLTGSALAARDIDERSMQGDATATALIERYANLLALGLSTVINIIDPEIIVLGGGMSKTASVYPQVDRWLERYVFSDQIRTRVMPNVHGDSGGVRGAAWLWPLDTDTD